MKPYAFIASALQPGLIEFIQALYNAEWNIICIDSELEEQLRTKGISSWPLVQITNANGFLTGASAALHPAILEGIVADRSNEHEMKMLHDHHIRPIDMVVADLHSPHPNAETELVATALIKYAVTNPQYVYAVFDPRDYGRIIQSILANVQYESQRLRAQLARKANDKLTSSDAIIRRPRAFTIRRKTHSFKTPSTLQSAGVH